MQNIKSTILAYHLGNFKGYNITHSKAIPFPISGQEIIDWNHDLQGQSEFWPSEDNDALLLIFRGDSKTISYCTRDQLLEVDRILLELGNDSLTNFAKIYSAINNGYTLKSITGDIIKQENTFIFIGSCFYEMQKQAAWELFETFYPALFDAFCANPVGGVQFNCKRFLNSPSISSQQAETTNFKIIIANLR